MFAGLFLPAPKWYTNSVKPGASGHFTGKEGFAVADLGLKGKVRSLHADGVRDTRYWRVFILCMLAAALLLLPFQIIDGGFFHYAGDFNSQQISFYRYMNAFVKAGGTFAWPADLGSGAVNAYSFYLYGSPFFWLSLIFPAAWLPYLMCPLLALKFGVAGGGAYLYLRRYAKNPDMAVAGACLYAFSGFAVYSIFFNHFVDVVALFPYLLWALDGAVYEGRRGRFAFFAALNLINNYFFFAGQILFLVIYFVCKLLSGEYKLNRRLFAVLAVESILAAGMGCILAWPAVLSLAQNPRTVDLSSGWGFLTYGKVQQYLAILFSWILPPDSPYLTSVWSEGVIKWTNLTAYLPLCSLSGVLAYWKARRGGSIRKILGTCAVFALVPVLNSAFYALNSSFYARWYYMPILMMSLATMQALEDESVDMDAGIRPVAILMGVSLVFALVPVYDADSETWSVGVLENAGQFFAVLLFGLAGLFLFWLLQDSWRGRKGFARRLTGAILAFGCLFGICHVGIGKFGQWNTDSNLVAQYQGALAVKEILPEGGYRVDDYDSHDNLGLWLDRSNLEYFGSTVAPSILDFYPDVGVKRDVRSQPDISNYALRGLLSVRYMLVPEEKTAAFEQAADAGWKRSELAAGGFVLYENLNYIPMGFTYTEYITEEQYAGVAEAERAGLLTRAILLSDEQIAQYGSLLKQMDTSALYSADYETYAAGCAARRETACSDFVMTNTGFTATMTQDAENLVFFSVPYDDGFTATVNGEKTKILNVDHGMMAIVCPAGTSNIVFTYHTAGLSLSSTISGASCVLFAAYLVLYRLRRKKHGAFVQNAEQAAALHCIGRPFPPAAPCAAQPEAGLPEAGAEEAASIRWTDTDRAEQNENTENGENG